MSFHGEGGSETMAVFTKNGAVELYFDNTLRFLTNSIGAQCQGDFSIPLDNEELRIGAGNDLRAYHNGANSVISNATGEFRIVGDDVRLMKADQSEPYFVGSANGGVELYYDNSKKLETTANGVSIEAGSPNLQVLANTDGENAILTLIGRTAAGGVGTAAICRIEAESKQSSNSASEMKFKTRTTGNVITTALTIDENQHINLPIDNQKLKLGASADLQIYHDGSNSFISDTGTGGLKILGSAVYIKNVNDHDMVEAISGGAVSLFHDNSKKFETVSDGAAIPVDGYGLKIGANNDVRLYHETNNWSYLAHYNTSGNLGIESVNDIV